jgi:hypothetical protein
MLATAPLLRPHRGAAPPGALGAPRPVHWGAARGPAPPPPRRVRARAEGVSPDAEASAAPAVEEPALPPAVARRAAAAADAAEALDALGAALGTGAPPLGEAGAQQVMAAALERGNVELALAIFRAMTAAVSGLAAPPAAAPGAPVWPPASAATAAALAIGLCRALRAREAIAVVDSVRRRGLPPSEDGHFGTIVAGPPAAPGAPPRPLALVQPGQGVQAVADAATRYEYELFSGEVREAAAESLGGSESWARRAARRAGLVRAARAAAEHALVVETPAGAQRSFRFGTATADVPAKVGDRVTVVCAPVAPKLSAGRLLSASPPGAAPGEALSLTNHSQRGATPLLPPPAPGGAAGGAPSWALPVALLLAASDAASALVDPALPYLATGALLAAGAAAVAGSTVLVPRLKQLPERAVEAAAGRQRLLAQHAALEARAGALAAEAGEDCRALARLWGLQGKMGAVAAGAEYDARRGRVAAAAAAGEVRLAKALEVLDAYARVVSMIEIEVEVEAALPADAEEGIDAQIARLEEVEELAADWRLQAEAADDVERMLRALP